MPKSKSRRKPTPYQPKKRKPRKRYPWDPFWRNRLYVISTPTRLVATRSIDLVRRECDRAMAADDVVTVHRCQWLEVVLG